MFLEKGRFGGGACGCLGSRGSMLLVDFEAEVEVEILEGSMFFEH